MSSNNIELDTAFLRKSHDDLKIHVESSNAEHKGALDRLTKETHEIQLEVAVIKADVGSIKKMIFGILGILGPGIVTILVLLLMRGIK